MRIQDLMEDDLGVIANKKLESNDEEELDALARQFADDQFGLEGPDGAEHGFGMSYDHARGMLVTVGIRMELAKKKEISNDRARANVWKEDMNEAGDELIEELRSQGFGDFEIDVLSPWSVTVVQAQSIR